jgi:transcriptional regulator with XRE-family HTH domain
MDTLGERLKLARKQADYSQLDVYRLTDINNKTLSHYENNSTTPDPETLKKLIKLYNVPADYILGITVNTSMAMPQIINDFQFDSVDLVNKFNNLSVNAKEKVVDYIEMLKIVDESESKAGKKDA